MTSPSAAYLCDLYGGSKKQESFALSPPLAYPEAPPLPVSQTAIPVLREGRGIVAPPSSADVLTEIATEATKDGIKQSPVTAYNIQCCPNPGPCAERIGWQAQFKHCPPAFATGEQMQCEVAPIGDRYYIADLNDLMYKRSILSGQLWNPYEHMNARQLHAQFLWADLRKDGDPYTRPIKTLDDTFCAQLRTKGPPAYTTF